jgi:hypothetical protein
MRLLSVYGSLKVSPLPAENISVTTWYEVIVQDMERRSFTNVQEGSY